MIRLKQAVIVEGKYDKITLENVIDATIIPTNGFSVFKDKEKCALIRLLAERDGIIVLTDSDNAGMMIRSYLKQICGKGNIIHVYVPQLAGKERRKTKPGKQGLLGVEGMTPEILAAAFARSGVTVENRAAPDKRVTKTDLFRYGLSGGENSTARRQSFMRYLDLPQNLTANAFLDIVNTIFSDEEFEERVNSWQSETDKR